MVVDKKAISELIRRQMVILGPDITMARVKNVLGIQVDANGEVISIDRDPQVVLTDLTNQFVELSGLIVKKTMQVLTAQREIESLNKVLNQ